MASSPTSAAHDPYPSASNTAPHALSFSTPVAVALACMCAALGLLTIFPTVQTLLTMWRADDLRSMGMLVPFVSFALILRSWRQIGWRSGGSWWGFALLAGVAALMFVESQVLLVVVVDKDWLLPIPPLPFVAIAYAAAMVLLFGGKRLLRAAWFGVLFMGMIIPVPHIFSRWVDLPLQHASATVARGFAHLLGQQLTQDKLRLMFTPTFGMFIAPGCNGIRGAVTLGLAALVVSYVYRFRPVLYAPVVAGAVLLGYLFNFLRLCLLVVYYMIALPHPWLQKHGEGADYLIGGALFCLALLMFFAVANRLRNEPAETLPVEPGFSPVRRAAGFPLLARTLAILCLAAIFGVDAYHVNAEEVRARTAAPHADGLPQQIGGYRLQRTWNDVLPSGVIVYSWGDYAKAGDDGPHVALGVSPVLDSHDTEVCHLARGEDPVFHGQTTTQTPGGDIDLKIATYNNGTVQWLEGSTICSANGCHEFSKESQHIRIVYARPQAGVPLSRAGTRSVPILLKLETIDVRSQDEQVRKMLLGRMQEFLRELDLPQLARPYEVPTN